MIKALCIILATLLCLFALPIYSFAASNVTLSGSFFFDEWVSIPDWIKSKANSSNGYLVPSPGGFTFNGNTYDWFRFYRYSTSPDMYAMALVTPSGSELPLIVDSHNLFYGTPIHFIDCSYFPSDFYYDFLSPNSNIEEVLPNPPEGETVDDNAGIIERLKSIAKVLLNLNTMFGTSIVTPITSALNAIFVPKDDFLTDRFNSLYTRFSFVGSIVDTYTILSDTFESFATVPPVLTIPVSPNRSQYGYDYGVTEVTLDFSWYSEYKESVDLILSGFILVGFFWRQFHNLPATISGQVTSITSVTSSLHAAESSHKRRSK